MDKPSAFTDLLQDIKQHDCSLRAGCIQPVPGVGNIDSSVVFVGEAPGKNEDEQGAPFVGAAGRVLEEALLKIGWDRSQVYITNIVKCRPPNNRDPEPAEVEEHRPFLTRELDLITPKLIVLLGRHALHWFLPGEKISEVHGRAKRHLDKVYFIAYHPAATLYDPRLKQTFFEDIAKIPTLLNKLTEISALPTSSVIQSEFDL